MTISVGLAPTPSQTRNAQRMNADATKIYRQGMQMRSGKVDTSPHDAYQWCTLASQLLHPQRSHHVEADKLYQAGRLAYCQGQVKQAIALLDRARVLNFVTEQPGAEAKALTLLGLAYRRNRQYRAALGCHMDAWQLYLEKHNPIGEIVNLAYLGRIYEQEGMPLSALDAYQRAIALLPAVDSSTHPNMERGLESEIPLEGTLENLVLKMTQALHQAGELEHVASAVGIVHHNRHQLMDAKRAQAE
ncbi:MAG: tetratricopeptide repeat protein [Merismopedia sp. SIO2A8]|nr:tetratricopeptide repeat protein [Merismopedia sp. SIO2A8]